jgi:hypothetical protein
MKHLFVPYDIALTVRDKGFDEPCLAWYDTDKEPVPYTQTHKEFDTIKSEDGFDTAPLYQQVIDWFRDEHKIHIEMMSIIHPFGYHGYTFQCYSIPDNHRIGEENAESWGDYYEALTEAIRHALTLLP